MIWDVEMFLNATLRTNDLYKLNWWWFCFVHQTNSWKLLTILSQLLL